MRETDARQAADVELLSVSDLSVRFRTRRGAVEAIRDVSYSIPTGGVLGIVGETGSGKSVAVRAVMGLLPPSAEVTGRAVFAGRDLLRLDGDELRAVRGREIGMVFQNPSSHLDPLRRIGWQIASPLRRHAALRRGEAQARAVELLRSVGIGDPERRAEAYPHEFSGGMKQRAMIAAAIGCGPRLLIADEPTTALDTTVQARILALLRDLNRAHGLAIVLISHDLGVIAENCDRLVVMRRGEVVEQGSTREVLAAPVHAYTKLLIASQPSLRPGPRAADSPRVEAPLLSIRDLSVEFVLPGRLLHRLTGSAREAAFKALDRVTLEVRPGETVGIVGESGSGKSTLARAIMGLNKASSGKINFDGRDVLGLEGEGLRAFRRAIQMVFQNPYDSLNPRLSVSEAVGEPVIRHALASSETVPARVAALLDMVELPRSLSDRRPGQLSGGQCQRVGIARALAMQPRLLIADEITSALDVTTQAQILALLERLKVEQGLTVLYISHDLSVVSSICQRVYVFRAGRVVESGHTRKVMSEPQEDYTRQLVRSIPRVAGFQFTPPAVAH